MARAIADGLVDSAHDVSDGGVLVALAEMLIGGSTVAKPIGASVDGFDLHPFEELPCRYLLEVTPEDVERVGVLLGSVPCSRIATLDNSGSLQIDRANISVEDMARVWRGPLDW